MKLTPIHSDHPHYAQIERLYLDAFPEAERRPADIQRQNIDSHPAFTCYMATEEEGGLIGFITGWALGAFAYLEHFAVDPSRRNGGYGGRIIRQLVEALGCPVVLEVEHPDNELSRRRIGFYERQGFTVWDKDYVQPPYRIGGESLPLYLMITAGTDNSALTPQEVTRTIHRTVYGVEA